MSVIEYKNQEKGGKWRLVLTLAKKKAMTMSQMESLRTPEKATCRNGLTISQRKRQ